MSVASVRDRLLSFARASQPRFLLGRWVFLRGLGLLFASVFASLAIDIHGLIGPFGLCPATSWLARTRAEHPSAYRFLKAPTLLWLRADDAALTVLVAVGLICAAALIANVLPRVACVGCAVCLVSFLNACSSALPVSQPDGVLIEAAVIAALMAPRGLRPALGASSPTPRVAWVLLIWLWFRIYFESGVAKLVSVDPGWRHLDALDHYFETQPFPTELAWYAQNAPHWFHALCAVVTLVIEVPVALAGLVFVRARRWVFVLATGFQAALLVTGNFAALTYVTILLGVALLDDDALRRLPLRLPTTAGPTTPSGAPRFALLRAGFAVCMIYASIAVYARGSTPLAFPSRVLLKLQLADRFDLFESVPRKRWLLELQGSSDGESWAPYAYRYTPQDPFESGRVFAPYQPRFDWNLWLCAHDGNPMQCPLLRAAALRLDAPEVASLFRGVPFERQKPRYARIATWRYEMTTPAERARSGAFWRKTLARVDPVATDEISASRSDHANFGPRP